MKKNLFISALLLTQFSFSQNVLKELSVERIMRDPKWIGTTPTQPQWSANGKYLFFKWNPEKAPADSFYYISMENKVPQKATPVMIQNMILYDNVNYNGSRTACTYSKNGDIFLRLIKDNSIKQITQTTETETDPQFCFDDNKIIYRRDQNLYAWDIASGITTQLTNFKKGTAQGTEKATTKNTQEKWLSNDQLQNFDILRQREQTKRITESLNNKLTPKELRSIYTEDKTVQGITISPNGRFITYCLIKTATSNKTAIVPNYITESGFTENIPTRTKVGEEEDSCMFYVFDREKDTVILVETDMLPGIKDLPDYVNDYPTSDKKPVIRPVMIHAVCWSQKNTHAFVNIYSQDNKDRWIMLLDAATGKLTPIDRQRDEAWISGPGIDDIYFGAAEGWIDENTIWFQSEASGYSHIYMYNVNTRQKKQLTSGDFEIRTAQLSGDKKSFYITTNQVHPGEHQFYHLAISSGKTERITTMTGANEVVISPDEKQIAFLYSYSNKPWELYIQKNIPGTIAQQITDKAQSDEFKTYPWRDPLVMTFKASDGANVYARLYKPSRPDPKKPAVIFVHGGGYLQNAHKWWSRYFREFMFHNLLCDLGYTVMDVDYRGSEGYGRNWRVGIYRHMGGKDLDDQIDAAKYLVDSLGIDKNRIGMYGGSYGGFMTLMAMFTKPNIIRAGAALRPVTDWAHYNHWYTSNILNEPFTDSLSYKRSSPIYFANGLKNPLLICHGMVDENVHFQDAVLLAQRLIELGKDNWELAAYPMEDHGFVEPSSWTDEYKRILKLFEENLRK